MYISVENQPFYLQASFYYSNVFTVLFKLGTAASSVLSLQASIIYIWDYLSHVYSRHQLRSWFPVCLCIRLTLPLSSGLQRRSVERSTSYVYIQSFLTKRITRFNKCVEWNSFFFHKFEACIVYRVLQEWTLKPGNKLAFLQRRRGFPYCSTS